MRRLLLWLLNACRWLLRRPPLLTPQQFVERALASEAADGLVCRVEELEPKGWEQAGPWELRGRRWVAPFVRDGVIRHEEIDEAEMPYLAMKNRGSNRLERRAAKAMRRASR